MRCAVQLMARVTAQSTARDARVVAVEELRVWLPDASGSDWEADLYKNLAEHAWWAGQPDAAVAFADRACLLAERLGAQDLLGWCLFGRADLYLRSGQPEKAIALLPAPEPAHPPFGRIQRSLKWAQALHAVGDRTAGDWLADARGLIEQYGYAPFQKEADELARSF
jgi:hypothetical protein